jgi:hypothetical protein
LPCLLVSRLPCWEPWCSRSVGVRPCRQCYPVRHRHRSPSRFQYHSNRRRFNKIPAVARSPNRTAVAPDPNPRLRPPTTIAAGWTNPRVGTAGAVWGKGISTFPTMTRELARARGRPTTSAVVSSRAARRHRLKCPTRDREAGAEKDRWSPSAATWRGANPAERKATSLVVALNAPDQRWAVAYRADTDSTTRRKDLPEAEIEKTKHAMSAEFPAWAGGPRPGTSRRSRAETDLHSARINRGRRSRVPSGRLRSSP